jgi:hypothetical protein
MPSVASATRTCGIRREKGFGITGWDTKGIPWMTSMTRSKRTSVPQDVGGTVLFRLRAALSCTECTEMYRKRWRINSRVID